MAVTEARPLGRFPQDFDGNMQFGQLRADGLLYFPRQNNNGSNPVEDAPLAALLGTLADIAWTSGSGSVISILKAIATSDSVLDDWDESDRAKINQIVGQVGITGGAGAVAANTPRTTLASDDPLVARFIAAALLADGMSLPTVTRIGAILKAYNGSTTDLVRLIAGVGVSDHDKVLAVGYPGRSIQINSGALAPTGSDITALSGTGLATTDFAIRNTADHYFRIPMLGYRRVLINFQVNPAFDQNMTIVLYQGSLQGNNDINIYQATLNSGSVAQYALGTAIGGPGGAPAGTTTVGNQTIAVIPALDHTCVYLSIRVVFGVAPTAGTISNIIVTRSR